MSASTWFKIRHDIGPVLLFFLIAPLLPVATLGQNQPPIFPMAQFTPPAGVVVSSLATGDFNGDGQPDLAYISVPGTVQPVSGPVSTLTVLLNQGANSPPVSVTTSSLNGCPLTSGLYSLVSADMNKDNKLDLVLTCPAGYVAVLLGNGDGSFQSPAYYAVSAPQILAPMVDLNGDGYLDVAVSTLIGNSSGVAVLLNQGSTAPGTLSTAKSYPGPTGLNAASMGAGDFNGDGKQDILVSGGRVGGGPLAVFYGNGDGTLQTAQTTPGGGLLATGDFNHDGLTDVAYVGGTLPPSSSLQVLLGNSSGKFTTGINLPLSNDLGNVFPLIAGTTNGGSNVDLALVGNYTSIFLGDGNGGFTPGNSYALSGFPSATEAGSDGKTNLVLNAAPGFSVLAGNGDGTFQGISSTLMGEGDFVPTDVFGEFVTADVNGDGLTDVLAVATSGDLISALGRGDGTFSPITTTAGGSLSSLVTGDFNGDGKVDAVGISQSSTIVFYSGNGNGTFQPGLPGVALPITGAGQAVAGDFNGDNLLDLVLPYSPNYPSSVSGLVFVPGKGDGTFGSPVVFSPQNTSASQELLVADLNNDKKLDLIWNGAVYLGNGDGTFQQMPLGLSGTPLAIADLNGDGIPDVVMGITVPGSASVYAGNGNGTFQPSPFYTVPLQYESVTSASVGDVNADGHPDLLLQYSTTTSTNAVLVLLGDGRGNFSADNNTYYTTFFDGSSGGVLARLNDQAPKLPNDNALDYLSFSIGAVTTLLNQTNPKPTPPALNSNTTLAVSANSADENQQLTFTATVTGLNPTGNVSFVSGSTTLGTATVANGTATLAASFAAAGTYAVTANYAGDSENLPSTSSAVSIAVTAPDFTVSVSPATASVTAGQSAAATLTVTPVAGYSGTVSFSCGTLPSGEMCSFAPASVTPANAMASSSKLTITTTAPSTATRREDGGPLNRIAYASIVFLLLLPRRLWQLKSRRIYSAMVIFFLMSGLLSLLACGHSPNSAGTPTTPGTPTGTQTITVSTTDSTGKLSHSVTLQIMVQ